jgi:hypothetical protein
MCWVDWSLGSGVHLQQGSVVQVAPSLWVATANPIAAGYLSQLVAESVQGGPQGAVKGVRFIVFHGA